MDNDIFCLYDEATDAVCKTENSYSSKASYFTSVSVNISCHFIP